MKVGFRQGPNQLERALSLEPRPHVGRHRALCVDAEARAGGGALLGRGGAEMLQVHAVFDHPNTLIGDIEPLAQLPGDKGGVGDEDHVALACHLQLGLPVHSVHGIEVHADPPPPGTAFLQPVEPCPVYAVARPEDIGRQQPFMGLDEREPVACEDITNRCLKPAIPLAPSPLGFGKFDEPPGKRRRPRAFLGDQRDFDPAFIQRLGDVEDKTLRATTRRHAPADDGEVQGDFSQPAAR